MNTMRQITNAWNDMQLSICVCVSVRSWNAGAMHTYTMNEINIKNKIRFKY